MKLVVVSVHFEYTDVIEDIIDRHSVPHYLVYPRIEGRDSEGFHEGSQVHPGNLAALHLRVDDDGVRPLLDDLEVFRLEKRAHNHLEAIVLPIEDRMGP
ncbi:MAG: PG0541 family transporter-associated protein [Pseudomonadota bacterium]